jgi:GT2 family glycosyltransferase
VGEAVGQARVDVIVLNYNGRTVIGPCLAALRAQTYRDFRILVVDNGSSDGSVAYLRECHPDVALLALPTNLGFCAGNNRGIEATGGQYVALLNNDTEAAPTWLEALVGALDRDPDVGFCASRLLRLSDPATIDAAGDLFYTHGVGAKRGSGEPERRFRTREQVFGACAGAAIYRRAMLERIGLLDEDFFAIDEDVDLSFRAQLQGYRCLYVPDAVVRHHVGASFAKVSGLAVALARRNMVEVLLKNMPASLLLRHGAPMVGYLMAGDLKWAARGHAREVLRARWENVRRLPRTLAKRRAIQRSRTIEVSELSRLLTPGGVRALLGAAVRRLRPEGETGMTS